MEGSYPWALDLWCGIGGLSWGLRRAGFATAGIDPDPVGAAFYRQHCGVAWVGDPRTYAEDRKVLLVAAHAPWRREERFGIAAALAARHADALLLFCHPRALPAAVAAARATRFKVHSATLRAEAFGVPQRRRRGAVVAFRHYRVAERFRWPHRSVDRPATVREAIGRPYDAPSPALRPGELTRSAPRGDRGGTSRSRTHATEVMAAVARQHWGPYRLTPAELAALQGLPPSWDWSWATRAYADRLIVGALSPALAAAVGGRIRDAFVSAGREFADLAGAWEG